MLIVIWKICNVAELAQVLLAALLLHHACIVFHKHQILYPGSLSEVCDGINEYNDPWMWHL